MNVDATSSGNGKLYFYFTKSGFMNTSLVPPGCTAWSLTKPVDILNDPPEYLMKTFPVYVGDDLYEGRTFERHSLFTFITSIDDFEMLINRFSVAELFHYKNELTSGNIIHDLVKNPNPECYFKLCESLTDEELSLLANDKNKFGEKPIEYVTAVDIFKDLAQFTKFVPTTLLSCIQNNNGIANYVIDVLYANNIIDR